MGFFGSIIRAVKKTGQAVGNTVDAAGKLVYKTAVFIPKTTADIVMGRNVKKTFEDRGGDYVQTVLDAAAGPTKVIHSITGPLGIQEPFDIIAGAVPVYGTYLTLSQVAETIEEIQEIQKHAKEEEARMKEGFRKLQEWIDSLPDVDEDGNQIKK